MRKEEEGESVDSFVTDLYTPAEHCSCGGLHDEMIRDHLVVRLELQLDTDHTLEIAITIRGNQVPVVPDYTAVVEKDKKEKAKNFMQ